MEISNLRDWPEGSGAMPQFEGPASWLIGLISAWKGASVACPGWAGAPYIGVASKERTKRKVIKLLLLFTHYPIVWRVRRSAVETCVLCIVL